MFVFLLIQLFIPLLFILILFRSRPPNRTRWLLTVMAFGLAILYLTVTTRWDLISYYFIILIPLLFLGAAIVSYFRIAPPEKPESSTQIIVNTIIYAILIIFFTALNFFALRGWLGPAESVDLSYPLQEGVYYVVSGGDSPFINIHNKVPPQDFALDIVRLNMLGQRVTLGGEADDLTRYEIFEDPVFSPCAGTVIRAEDGHPDLIPPATDSVNLAGNHVLLGCQGIEILLAHLQEGSLVVEEGATVVTGELLGRVGNSGNTSEPHLHIHGEGAGEPGRILDGQAVALRFAGRFLVRNSLFSGED